ncbi:MAG: hypothetical protein DMG88_21285 [Acidobacteria bacterium]|nr:MAG: hypothetical protein DMG88_21285 [Acidobacteriota bacterium]
MSFKVFKFIVFKFIAGRDCCEFIGKFVLAGSSECGLTVRFYRQVLHVTKALTLLLYEKDCYDFRIASRVPTD